MSYQLYSLLYMTSSIRPTEWFSQYSICIYWWLSVVWQVLRELDVFLTQTVILATSVADQELILKMSVQVSHAIISFYTDLRLLEKVEPMPNTWA